VKTLQTETVSDRISQPHRANLHVPIRSVPLRCYPHIVFALFERDLESGNYGSLF
jgi:hypothetical protein